MRMITFVFGPLIGTTVPGCSIDPADANIVRLLKKKVSLNKLIQALDIDGFKTKGHIGRVYEGKQLRSKDDQIKIIRKVYKAWKGAGIYPM